MCLLAGFQYLVCLPFRWLGWFEVEVTTVLHVAAILTLGMARALLPRSSGQAFFAVLGARDKVLAFKLEQTQAANSWSALAWQLVRNSVLSALVVLVVVLQHASMALFIQGVVAAVAVVAVGLFVHSWFIIVPVCFAAVVLVCMGVSLGAYVAPFLTLWRRVDPVVAFLALVLAVVHFSKVSSVHSAFQAATTMYFSCTLLSHELLTQYRQRIAPKEWVSFTSERRWYLFGIGLPIWLLVHFAPPLAVALLEIFHGVGGGTLVDLLAVSTADTKAPQKSE